jgi:Ca2+-binding RTX toxin-like protein
MTDWYVFTITAATTVTLDIDGGMNDIDTWLNLYNSNLQLLRSNDDSSTDPGSLGRPFNSSLTYDAAISITLQPGTYYVQVARYPNTTFDSASDDYTLHFSAANVVDSTADTTAPDAPALDLAADSDTGASNSDNITSDPTPTIIGTAEAASTVRLYEGTTLLGTTTANSSGVWSLTLASALADGAHMLSATATDGSGNVSNASGALTVTIDTAIADPTIDQNSPDADTTPELIGTAEAGSTVQIHDGSGNLLGTATADSSGNWVHQLATALRDGDYMITATATDAAGNVSNAVGTVVSIVVEGAPINGGNGADTLTGTDGRDNINGGNGTDSLSGGWGADQMFGGNGADLLVGGAGNDFLYGENGADRLEGCDGDDLLNGGRGDDLLLGGAGYDTFVAGRSSGNDTIGDFEVGSDRLHLEDDLSVSSLESSGGNTLVHLSNDAVITLEGVIVSTTADLFPTITTSSTLLSTTSTDDGCHIV